MTGYYFGLLFLTVCALWLFLKASNEGDEFAGLVGHGIATLTCALAIGVGISAGHPWIIYTAVAIFAVNVGFLLLRIRHT